MSIESRIVRHVTAPLWMIRDGRREELRYRREFRALNALPTTELRARQLRRLRRLIQHAAQNCPFYAAEIARASIDPACMEGEELASLPIVTKEVVRDNIESMIATNISSEQLYEANTGGSTGVPMKFYRDRRCLSLRRAQECVFDAFMGLELGDRAALFVAASHVGTRLGTWKEAIRNRTDALLLRFDPARTREDEMQEFYQSLLRFRPRFIRCFPNALAIFTEFVDSNDLPVPEMVAISCTGENVYGWQKELFSRVWKAPVYERYGTKECVVIYGEEEVGAGQRIFLEGAYVELLDDDGRPVPDGVPGRVILTDLFNYGMPLIRYEIGDVAIAKPDAGDETGFPRFEKIIGRDRDILIAADGTKKPGYLFVEEISKASLDAKFQIVQKQAGTLEVRIANSNVAQETLRPVIEKFRTMLGAESSVYVKMVDDIPRDPSGKYRYVKSELG